MNVQFSVSVLITAVAEQLSGAADEPARRGALRPPYRKFIISSSCWSARVTVVISTIVCGVTPVARFNDQIAKSMLLSPVIYVSSAMGRTVLLYEL